MKQIKYTPDAADKLRAIKKAVSLQYGSKKAKDVVGSIVSAIRGLTDYEESGPTVEGMFGVDTTPQETLTYWKE